MPRAFDRRIPRDDHNPLRGLLDFTSVDSTVQDAGGAVNAQLELVRQFAEQLVRELLQNILDVALDPGQAIEDLLGQLPDWVAQIPGLAQLVEWITGTTGDVTDLQTFLQDKWDGITESLTNFASILSGFGLGSVGAWITDLLGTKSTANTASSNATTSLGNWTSWLTGGSWANIAASVADFLGTKSTANTASSNATTALGNFTSLISGAGESTLAAVASAIGTAKSNFSSLLSGMSVGSIGSLVSDLLGTKSTANTADSNASTGLANWLSALTGSGDANAGALGSSLSTAKSNASTAVGNFTTLFSNFSVANLAAWSADLLGTKSTASTASSNATTALGNFTTLLSNASEASVAALGSAFATAKSNASSAVSSISSLLSGMSVGSIGSLVSSLLGTASTANTASSNASTALSNAGTALTNAATATSTASTVATNLQSTWNKLVDAFTGGSGSSGQTETTAAEAAAVVTTTANTANAAALAAQATLAEQETTTPTGGNSSTYTPSGSDGAALMGWTTGPTSGDMCIRVNNGVTAIGVKSGKGSGRVYGAYTTKQYATVDQSASIVLGELPWGSSSETTTIKIRSTSGLTNGAYCHVESDGVKIGYYTFSGGTWTFNQLATQATTIRSGDRVTFRCYGLNYYVLVNGVQVLSFTNVGNNVTQSVATNNYCGLSETRTASFVDFDSFRVTSFSMTDYFEGTTLATSFILTRSNTANAALSVANGAAAALPSFFSTQVTAVGVTVNTLATGEIQILTDGIYRLTGSFVAVGGTTGTSSSNFAPSWCVMLGGSQITGPIPSGVSIDIPLVAGNVIKPGIVAAVPNPTATRSNAQNYSGTQTAGNDISVTNVKGFSSWSGVLVEAA